MKKSVLMAVWAMILALPVSSSAQPRLGFYVGLQVHYATLGGDLDGETVLVGSQDIVFLPEVDPAFGFGILGGHQFTEHSALEFEILYSRHDGDFSGADTDVGYLMLNLNGKYNFQVENPVSPFVLLGLGLHDLTIDDGSASASKVGDAQVEGFAFNFGIGVDYILSPQVRAGVTGLFRYILLTEASGVEESGTIEDDIDATGFGIVLHTAYHFQ